MFTPAVSLHDMAVLVYACYHPVFVCARVDLTHDNRIRLYFINLQYCFRQNINYDIQDISATSTIFVPVVQSHTNKFCSRIV